MIKISEDLTMFVSLFRGLTNGVVWFSIETSPQLLPPIPTMTHLLPPNLLRFFLPAPPLPGLPVTRDEINPTAPPSSTRRSTGRRQIPPLTGVASFLERVKQEAADKGEATEEGDTGFDTQIKKAGKNSKSNGKVKKEINGKDGDAEAMDEDSKEEDEEEVKESAEFTYAEQTKREVRREMKKKLSQETKERGLKECEYPIRG